MTQTLTNSETNPAIDNTANELDRPHNGPQIPGAENHIESDTNRNNASNSKESGGREGLDPTRYGDWEKAGRCIDF